MKKPPYRMIGLGLGALGLGIIAAHSGGASANFQPPRREYMEPPQGWIKTAIAHASGHEGNPSSVQTQDNAILSYGIIQWTLKSGNLYNVLTYMQRANPALFAQIFVNPTGLLEAAKAKSAGPVGDAYLNQEPWLSRFRAAGKQPDFIAAQWTAAAEGAEARAAAAISKMLGIASERAMVYYFDRAIHQGAHGATSTAARLVDGWKASPASKPTNDRDILLQFGWLCARPYRYVGEAEPTKGDWRRVSMEKPELSAGDRWPPVAKVTAPVNTFHKFNSWDLYEIIVGRTREILADSKLHD